jgi:hypothetical protein
MGMMRRAVAGLTTFVVAGLLLGCGDVARGPTGPDPLAAPLLDASAASATNVILNDQVPFNRTVFVSCANGGTGELVVISGTLHVLIHETISSSGNDHFKVHFQPQGISGVGLTTGDQYRATGVTQEHFNFNNLPVNDTFVDNFRIIGQGPGNNFLVHENFHFTINANGELTAVHDNLTVDCK